MAADTIRPFPNAFVQQNIADQEIRARSIAEIEADADLSSHAGIIEASAMFMYEFIHLDEHHDEDDLTIRLLGIRMFNCINAAIALLLTGYYQPAAQQIRDLIETIFLIDAFRTKPELIKEWREADDSIRWKKFRPEAVRNIIDTRDGLKERKRAQLYKLLSSLAAHPNPMGFTMFRLPNGMHHCGSFYEKTRMVATLSELAQAAVQAGTHFGDFFDPKTKPSYRVRLDYLIARTDWCDRHYGEKHMEPSELALMEAQYARMPD